MSVGLIPESQVVIEELHDGVLTLMLNRGDKLNALDLAMVDALHAAFAFYEHRQDVNVVIIVGAGERAFAAGADIGQLRDRRAADALQGINARLFDRIARFPAPTIAAVKGFALGGGCELAVACDIRIAGVSARFGQPETGLGIIAAAGATWRLPALIGLGRAREMLLSGRLVDAAEALQIGLVNQVVPDSEVLMAAREMATAIAKNDPLATRLTKQNLQMVEGDMEKLRKFASASQAVCYESTEKVRRMDEFLSRKRKKS